MHRRLLEESFKRDHHHARLVRLGAADPDFVCASPREPSSRARASERDVGGALAVLGGRPRASAGPPLTPASPSVIREYRKLPRRNWAVSVPKAPFSELATIRKLDD